MTDIKFFLCPMSKNIVDAILGLKNPTIGFLPSRRQVDYDGGYTGWSTETFRKYVGDEVYVQRDHGGASQGKNTDDGKSSYMVDSAFMNLVHVDPWKTVSNIEEGLEKTIQDINFILEKNPSCKIEVGTEEAIFPISSEHLKWFITNLQKRLNPYAFKQIEYVVIQSGVKLDVINEKNIGKFNFKKLQDEIEICGVFGKKTKEHNGDFLSKEEREVRFKAGLTSINIGPELSIFENSMYLQHFTENQLKEADKICYESGLWKKWVTSDHDLSMDGIYFKICGHYNYSKLTLPNINIVEILKQKILNIIE